MNERIIRIIERADDDIEDLRRHSAELKRALIEAITPILKALHLR